MKPQNRNKRNDLDSGHVHRPKRSCSHLAQEVREAHGKMEEHSEQLVRRLLPSARLKALGIVGPATHRGWSPSIKPDRIAA